MVSRYWWLLPPAVVAANALKKKISKDFGFRYFAPRAEREKAVKKWKEWLAGRR